MGQRARFKRRALKGVRYFVLPPPFNRWLVFYTPMADGVEMKPVPYGSVDWPQEPERFF